MQSIGLDNPAWFTTFPHRVTPYPNEWLAGLLLRCDEANYWEAGTSMAHIRRTSSKFPSDPLNIIAPPLVYLEQVSLILALPLPIVVATTYRSEVKRLSGETRPLFIQPQTWFRLSLCPKCVTGRRLLPRTFLKRSLGSLTALLVERGRSPDMLS